jgi:hypothetical protein
MMNRLDEIEADIATSRDLAAEIAVFMNPDLPVVQPDDASDRLHGH